MDIEVLPIQPHHLEELRQFLVEGFGLAAGGALASPAVMAWKYFDPIDDSSGPAGFVAIHAGRIVASVGCRPVRWAIGPSTRTVSANHGFDWCASRRDVAAGLLVGRSADALVDVQYAIGGGTRVLALKRTVGYRFPQSVPTYCRQFHHVMPRGVVRTARAAARAASNRGRALFVRAAPVTRDVRLRPTTVFGAEIDALFAACPMADVRTTRTAGLLNHYVRHPAGAISGWHVVEGTRIRGWLLLSLIDRGGLLVGKIADCFLDCMDADLWHAAVMAGTRHLEGAGAERVHCFGSTGWFSTVLERAGFFLERSSPLSVLDRAGCLPDGATFYLTHLEADHAYL